MTVEKIAEVFDMTPHTEEISQVVVPTAEENAEDTDFEYARQNYYELISQGQAAMNTAMRIAAESENPRAIEVLSGLLKNMADVNRQLIQMSKDKADVKTAKGTKTGQPIQQIGSVQNAVFVGNSADLNKMLAEKMK
jgi:hypothetical protein